MKSIRYDIEEAANVLRASGCRLQAGRSPYEVWRCYDRQKGFVAVAYMTGKILPQGRRPEALLEILKITD